jgi:hypothetical protein
MVYVLQGNKLAETRETADKILADCQRDLIVIDAFYESWDHENGHWREDEICEIRKAKNGKIQESNTVSRIISETGRGCFK